MRSLKTAADLAGKVVLLRADLNVEEARDAYKLDRAMPTIKYLLEHQATVLVMSHRGRPDGKVAPELSLDFALPNLQEATGKVPVLVPHGEYAAIGAQLRAAPAGSLFVLENIRFVPGEEAQDANFATQLSSVGDIYVNDAFASDHHASVSVSVLPTLMPAYAGLLVEEEVGHLSRVLADGERPLIVIIGGGGKAGEKFAMVKNLYDRTDKFLIGGVMGNTFLKARGADIKNSQTDETILESVAQYLHDPKIVLPVDWVMNEKEQAMDIGPQSAALFGQSLTGARTVVWNGPMGVFEDPRYQAGSRAVAQAIADTGAFSVVGGGETTQFILEEKLQDKFSFLSTGGGAMLAFLAGKKLPGLAALE